MGLCDGLNSWKEEKKKMCRPNGIYRLFSSVTSVNEKGICTTYNNTQTRAKEAPFVYFFPSPSSSSMPAVPFSRSLFHLLLHPARLFFLYLETFAGESVMWPPTCGTYFIGLRAQGPGPFLFKRNKNRKVKKKKKRFQISTRLR